MSSAFLVQLSPEAIISHKKPKKVNCLWRFPRQDQTHLELSQFSSSAPLNIIKCVGYSQCLPLHNCRTLSIAFESIFFAIILKGLVPNTLNPSQLPRLQYCNSVKQESGFQCWNITRKDKLFLFFYWFSRQWIEQSSAWSCIRIPALQRHPLLFMLSITTTHSFTPILFLLSNEWVCIYYRESTEEVWFLCAIGLTIDGKAQCTHICLYLPCAHLSILHKISTDCTGLNYLFMACRISDTATE